jgi:hypothetical protein
MPVNMDPKRKRKPPSAGSDKNASIPSPSAPPSSPHPPAKPKDPEVPSEADLAEKEWKHLWEATEVIDMDKW